MTEYQTHTALVQSLEAEVSRLRAINAELKGIIEAGIKPNNSLVQAARQALEALEEATNYTSCPSWSPSMTDECNAAITALREALDAAHQPAAVGQEPVAWMFQHEEAGLIMCVDVQQVESGFEKNNPRWQKVCPLYKSTSARPPAADRQANSRHLVFGKD